MAANRVRLPPAAVERILTWAHHRSSRGWRPLTEVPTLLYSDESESLVYLVNAEIVVRPPALAGAGYSWGEVRSGSGDPQLTAVGATRQLQLGEMSRWGESVPDSDPEVASTRSRWAETLTVTADPAFSFSRPREAQPAKIWSARALPAWTRPASVDRGSSAEKRAPVRTWTAHVPPPRTT
ncbi:MAG: hypothetical protein ABR592_08240 [Nitriliruptorales bacterium]